MTRAAPTTSAKRADRTTVARASTRATAAVEKSTAHRGDPDLVELGAAIRARRKALGIRLHQVAAKTGLSIPFLSQIETGFAAPSLVSLFAVAVCLDTTPERLLGGPAPADVVLIRADQGRRYPVTDRAPSGVRRQLSRRNEPFSAAEYVARPRDDLGDFNSSSGRELLFVMAGRLAVDLRGPEAEVEHLLGPGDSIAYPTSVAHRWRHVGRAVTRFLVVVDDNA